MAFKEYIFLLGGHDLEMIEIRNILDNYEIKYLDDKLKWGAKLSAYKDSFDDEHTFVGIELIQDCDTPKNYILIDHHNENHQKPSSIEQVATLLGKELNRHQKLVAANDKGHIRAMKAICATDEEVKDIRKLDKDAQGVTEADEKLAHESANNRARVQNGITIVDSLTNKFSPIADLMYGKADRFIIYNASELVYYGFIPDEFLTKYKPSSKTISVFFSKDESRIGYYGIAINKSNLNLIEKELEKICKLMIKPEPEPIYSHHIFLFPFKWRKPNSMDTRFSDKNNMRCFDELIYNNWHNELFKFIYQTGKDEKQNRYDHYNEFNYFYEYVDEILYEFKDSSLNEKAPLLKHFEYQLPDETFYNIKLVSGIKYHLKVDSILLNIYSTGVGVLSFHMRNMFHSDENDILNINKFGRRIYVPFFDLNEDSIITGLADNTPQEHLLCETKKYEIPEAIWLGDKNGENELAIKTKENFEEYKDLNRLSHENGIAGTFIIPKFIKSLFGRIKLTSFKNNIGPDDIYIMPVLDDRMHVVSWYGNSSLARKQSEIVSCVREDYYAYQTNDWWYSYVFVDSFPMHRDKFVRKKLIADSSYSRWVEWGTMFGMSRYSMVMLTGDYSDTPKYLIRHLQTLYYKMYELCLVQRATVLSFSDEVTKVANLIYSKPKHYDALIVESIQDLYSQYLIFKNKIYFREITSQEQGIEMYDLIQNKMRIPQDVDELDKSIAELHDYVNMVEDRDRSKKVTDLNKLALFFLPATLITTFLGIGFITKELRLNFTGALTDEVWNSIIIVLCSGFGGLIVLPSLFRILRWGKKFLSRYL